MHPLDDITRGEQLIKTVYETIRNSPHWDRSMLIITLMSMADSMTMLHRARLSRRETWKQPTIQNLASSSTNWASGFPPW